MDLPCVIDTLRRNPEGVRFNELVRICDHFFGSPRQGVRYTRWLVPLWRGDPRVNIQNDRGIAKVYQVR